MVFWARHRPRTGGYEQDTVKSAPSFISALPDTRKSSKPTWEGERVSKWGPVDNANSKKKQTATDKTGEKTASTNLPGAETKRVKGQNGPVRSGPVPTRKKRGNLQDTGTKKKNKKNKKPESGLALKTKETKSPAVGGGKPGLTGEDTRKTGRFRPASVSQPNGRTMCGQQKKQGRRSERGVHRLPKINKHERS